MKKRIKIGRRKSNMAVFTDSVMEILQRNAGDEDITTFEGLMNVGVPIFFGEEMNVISEEYREKFELGFLLKFFFKELAFDSLTAWRMAFKEKIWNNADYINGVYGTLDKQIFSDYRVRKVNNAGTSKVITDVQGSNVNVSNASTDTEHSGNTVEANSNNRSFNENSSDVNASVNNANGESSNVKSGDDTTINTENSVTNANGTKNTSTDPLKNYDEKTITGEEIHDRNKSGSDVTNKIGKEKNSHNTTDTTQKTNVSANATGGQDDTYNKKQIEGTEVSIENRDVSQEDYGGYKDRNHNEDDNNNNFFQVNYDTPVSRISGLRSPGASAAGTGVGLLASETFNYMSSAAETGTTDDNESNGYTIHEFGEFDANGNKIANSKYEHKDSGMVKNTKVYGGVDSETGFQPGARYDEDTGNTQYGKSESKTDVENGSISRSGDDTLEFIERVDASSNNEVEYDKRHFNDYTEKNARANDVDETSNDETVASKGGTNVVNYNTTDAESHNNSDSSSSTNIGNRDSVEVDNGSRSSVDNSKDNVLNSSTNSGSNVSNTNQNGATTNVSEEVDYSYNMELLYRSMSLLDKVWDLFYDIFQIVLE